MPIQKMKCNENNCNHYLCKECPKKPIKLKPPTKKYPLTPPELRIKFLIINFKMGYFFKLLYYLKLYCKYVYD